MFYMGKAVKIIDHDFTDLAFKASLDEAALRAVVEVEARGSGFTSSGALICLYEPHIAYRYSSGTVRKALVKAGIAYPKWGEKPYPKTSYPRIDQCATIAGMEIACLATSWGMPQMMGFNYKVCGYSSASDMVKSFTASEKVQIEAMIRFIKSNRKMYDALVKKDWMTFAFYYNGSGYAKNGYHTKLDKAYSKWAKIIADRPVSEEKPQDKPSVFHQGQEPVSWWQKLWNWFRRLFTR